MTSEVIACDVCQFIKKKQKKTGGQLLKENLSRDTMGSVRYYLAFCIATLGCLRTSRGAAKHYAEHFLSLIWSLPYI